MKGVIIVMQFGFYAQYTYFWVIPPWRQSNCRFVSKLLYNYIVFSNVNLLLKYRRNEFSKSMWLSVVLIATWYYSKKISDNPLREIVCLFHCFKGFEPFITLAWWNISVHISQIWGIVIPGWLLGGRKK